MECDKRAYDSPKDAHDDLLGLRQRNKKHKFSVYKCPRCPYYHIVTITKRIMGPNKKFKYPLKYHQKQNLNKNNKRKNKKR